MSESVTEEQYKAILKTLDTIQDTMDRRFQEWSDDRKDIADLKVKVATLQALVEGTRDDIHENNKKVVNKISEKLDPLPEIVADGVEEGLKKKKK